MGVCISCGADSSRSACQSCFPRSLDGTRGGATFVAEFDFKRLNKQMRRVFVAMVGGEWRTLSEIAAKTKDPEASISARLRDFRKPKFGAWIVKRRRRGDPADGLFEYRLQRREHT